MTNYSVSNKGTGVILGCSTEQRHYLGKLNTPLMVKQQTTLYA